jgi:glycerol kinase
MGRYILGIDQGTTFTKAVIFNHDAKVISSAAVENKLYFPQPGWVEQDPDEIFSAVMKAVGEALKNGRIMAEDIEALGISNQLSTTIIWNKHTGEAVGRAIGWQDNRTLPICERLNLKSQSEYEARAGSKITPNCAASKIRWLMEHDRAIQRGFARGDLLYGSVDTWLIWKLSGGAFVTDLSNVSPSLLLNAHSLHYDEWILNDLGIPYEILPELHSTSEIYAYTKPEVFYDVCLPIAGDAGDQFAAVFGMGCVQPGNLSCNMGTGTSLVLNTGNKLYPVEEGVGSPVLWGMDGHVVRGLGSWINVSGAAIQWFRDELGIIKDIAEAEIFAARVPDTLGVYFVPAFTGLGSPYQDPYTRGTFFGITQGSSKYHLVRAALEAMAYQVKDAFDVMRQRSGTSIDWIRIGGGSAKNDFLMQFIADMLGIVVERPLITDCSVLGASFFAGLATGYWESAEETQALVRIDRRWEPNFSVERREELYRGWKKAIERSHGWLKD